MDADVEQQQRVADAGADAENANGGKQEGLTDFGKKKVVGEMNQLG